MTVCIAASCDDGRFIVSATDGQLTFGEITADVMSGKMVWINEWQFMFAGEPSNAQMIFEEMHDLDKGKPLIRENIKKVIRRAFKKRMGDCLASFVLSPYDMTLDEFKKDGLKMFGEREFSRLCKLLEDHAFNYYKDQILITGWGKTEFATMLYQVNAQGDSDSKYEGVATIGSGGNVAMSTLLLLGQSRHRSLVETVYNVAAAKFSAEKSYESGVGQTTLMYVQWKRTKDDPPGVPGTWLQDYDIKQLREIWEEYGKPRFPEPARRNLYQIVEQTGIKLTQMEQMRTMVSMIKQSSQPSNPQRSKDQQ